MLQSQPVVPVAGKLRRSLPTLPAIKLDRLKTAKSLAEKAVKVTIVKFLWHFCCASYYLFIYFNLRSTYLDEESIFHTWTLPCDSRCFMGQRLGWTPLSQSGPESHAGRRRQQWRHQRWWDHRNLEKNWKIDIYIFFNGLFRISSSLVVLVISLSNYSDLHYHSKGRLTFHFNVWKTSKRWRYIDTTSWKYGLYVEVCNGPFFISEANNHGGQA